MIPYLWRDSHGVGNTTNTLHNTGLHQLTVFQFPHCWEFHIHFTSSLLITERVRGYTLGAQPRLRMDIEQPSVTPQYFREGRVTIRMISTLMSKSLFVIPYGVVNES